MKIKRYICLALLLGSLCIQHTHAEESKDLLDDIEQVIEEKIEDIKEDVQEALDDTLEQVSLEQITPEEVLEQAEEVIFVDETDLKDLTKETRLNLYSEMSKQDPWKMYKKIFHDEVRAKNNCWKKHFLPFLVSFSANTALLVAGVTTCFLVKHFGLASDIIGPVTLISTGVGTTLLPFLLTHLIRKSFHKKDYKKILEGFLKDGKQSYLHMMHPSHKDAIEHVFDKWQKNKAISNQQARMFFKKLAPRFQAFTDTVIKERYPHLNKSFLEKFLALPKRGISFLQEELIRKGITPAIPAAITIAIISYLTYAHYTRQNCSEEEE